MKLDDRPVIDQITEPDPVNVVHEALAFEHDRVLDNEVEFLTNVKPSLKQYRDAVGTEDESWEREDHLNVIGGQAIDYAHAAIGRLADEILGRLA